MTQSSIRVHANRYLDSVKLLAGSRAILDTDGIVWGTVVTGTPANVAVLTGEGFDEAQLADVGVNDLILAARGEDVSGAFARAEEAMFAAAGDESPPQSSVSGLTQVRPGDALPNLAVISVAGEYAALEAHKALSADMDVLLFSDNVPLEAEVELKQRGVARSRFVMGPGAGTAFVDGVGLGFANAVRQGPIGVVAAAGTGAQEVMSLIHGSGLGVSQVIGVGGRDLSSEVGGIMTEQAIRSLDADADTKAILLVSKPPSPDVCSRILGRPTSKPVVAALIGLTEDIDAADDIVLCTDLESGVDAVLRAVGRRLEPAMEPLAPVADEAAGRLDRRRTAIRGLFSGGTMCFEAMTLMARHGLRVHSNTPLSPDLDLRSAGADAHVCLDLGAEEYTRGRPHPMIDPAARAHLIRDTGREEAVAVLLIDVVLGYGSHDDPAGELAAACAEVTSREGGPVIVAHVLGTDADPQGIDGQRTTLRQAGCILTGTNARAALTATAIATRTPEIADFRGDDP